MFKQTVAYFNIQQIRSVSISIYLVSPVSVVSGQLMKCNIHSPSSSVIGLQGNIWLFSCQLLNQLVANKCVCHLFGARPVAYSWFICAFARNNCLLYLEMMRVNQKNQNNELKDVDMRERAEVN